MADDRQVLREIWDGRVPVCFSLVDSEVNTISVPEPLYLLVPRLSYFPLVTDKVRRHFSRSVQSDSQNNEPWLEWDGTPLPWHQPVGLQFDLLGSDVPLPWQLNVHFTPLQDQNLNVCVKREALEAFFMSSVKEADQLKHRGQVISTLSKRDHNQLWAGLANDKFDQFWSVNRRLMESCATGGGEFRSIPARLHRPGAAGYIQRAVQPRGGDRSEPHALTTLEQLTTQLLPDAPSDEYRFVTQGIELPLEAPVLWLSQHLSYADNFLHIVALPRIPSDQADV